MLKTTFFRGLNAHLPSKATVLGMGECARLLTQQRGKTKASSENRGHLANRPLLWPGTATLRGGIDLDLPNNFGGRKVEIVKRKTNLPCHAASRRWFGFLR